MLEFIFYNLLEILFKSEIFVIEYKLFCWGYNKVLIKSVVFTLIVFYSKLFNIRL